jgi:urocanate hydratase
MLNPADLQIQVLRLYGELIARRPNYGGQLVFTCGETCSATGLPAAVSIAGGTTLAADSDAAMVKAVFRSGGLDFVVNTLDEAIRVLKNEVRKHTPLSVALTAEPAAVLAEMRERGIQPDLQLRLDPPANPLLVPPSPPPQLPGVPQLHLTSAEEIAAPTETLTRWLAAHSLTETLVQPTTNLRALDQELMSLLPAEDTARRHWLQRIPHYQRPASNSGRAIWLTPSEQSAIAS